MEAALYLHVPFCRGKCPYCDFYSVTEPPDESLYLSAVLAEVRLWRERIPRKTVFVTFYAGGGTPSLLSPDFYARLFEELSRLLSFSPVELTLEANPEGLSLKRLEGYLRAGFNRLSLGLQSLQPEGLLALGRRHGPEEARAAVEAARRAGFENLSLDFIFGWPGETPAHLQKDLDEALRLAPEHLSWYELTPEEGTPLFRALAEGRVRLPGEEVLVDMHRTIHERLTGEGFEHYEISNYARPGRRCLHNLFYWKALPYLGLGPAAASFLGKRRYRNPEDLKTYLSTVRSGTLAARLEEVLSPEEALREAVILSLRLSEGVRRKEFRRRFGRDPLESFSKEIKDLERKGLVEADEEGFRLTFAGRLLANQVQLHFV
ncbi:radical SAM family heme chaperone HemW [Thermosulfurimonas sp. F29]|uniref:radical SAM family heme chaperone HemW n=1 Tax=Thermosulfurimonas sp. F29 TaxID=2867247 RepID=UPI001C82FE0F|nr:radical SAM family heme chaperone HemW [Thermosulfurimonas sp. F29]MBX6422763.1 radical SAM family heme chaperone HemW [Thermosulfurimonas sp. F29]